MEKRFRLILGRSPADEIRRVRVETCKERLDKPDLSIDDIAVQFVRPQERFAIVCWRMRWGAVEFEV